MVETYFPSHNNMYYSEFLQIASMSHHNSRQVQIYPHGDKEMYLM